MPALTADRATPKRVPRDFSLPMAAGALIYAGAIACVNAAGLAVKGSTALNLKAVGVAVRRADNTGGANGAVRAEVERGCFRFANSASTDQITLADIGSTCFIVDDQTVAKTNGANTRSAAGTVRDVDATGVWVEF